MKWPATSPAIRPYTSANLPAALVPALRARLAAARLSLWPGSFLPRLCLWLRVLIVILPLDLSARPVLLAVHLLPFPRRQCTAIRLPIRSNLLVDVRLTILARPASPAVICPLRTPLPTRCC
jgi:hypothetical protein